MTSDRKIITKEQYEKLATGDWSFEPEPDWTDLPDALKHTDEEYEQKLKEILWHAEQLGNECRKVAKLEARIKELEANAPPKPTDDFIEELANLEHEQWMRWSKTVASSEEISEPRRKRWESYWIPYEKLPEDVKKDDRKEAMLVWGVLFNHKKEFVESLDR